MQAPIPADAVRAALSEVLERSDLRAKESLLERLIDLLVPDLSTAQVRGLGDLLQGLFLAAAVVAIVLFLRRLAQVVRLRRAVDLEAEPEHEVDPRRRLRELAARARAARDAGDLRLALRHLLQALLVALGGRGDLVLEPAWTNRELLRRGKATRAARELLEPLVRELEPKEFGRAPVGPEDVERLEALLAPHLEGEGRR